MGIAFEPAPTHNLLFTPLGLDRFVAIVPKESVLAARKSLSWEELLTLDFITLQRPSAVRLMMEEELAQRSQAGCRAGKSPAGDGWSNGCQWAWRQRRPGSVRVADDVAGCGLYSAGEPVD
jgi:LysR family carnitine catabolism transcriptional activator